MPDNVMAAKKTPVCRETMSDARRSFLGKLNRLFDRFDAGFQLPAFRRKTYDRRRASCPRPEERRCGRWVIASSAGGGIAARRCFRFVIRSRQGRVAIDKRLASSADLGDPWGGRAEGDRSGRDDIEAGHAWKI